MTARVIYDMPEYEYHAHPAFSQSGAKVLLDCPAKFKAGVNKTSPAKEFGTVFHQLLFIGNLDGYAVKHLNWATKEGKAEKAALEGKTIIAQADLDKAGAMVGAIDQHPVTGPLFADGIAEVSIFWTCPDTGVECKARLDWLPKRPGVLVDLKSIASGSPEGFGKAAAAYGWDIQDPVYTEAAIAGGLVDPDPEFLFVTVEKDAPYLVTPYQLPDEVREIGARRWAKAKAIYAECLARDEWPDYSGGGVLTAELPGWYFWKYDESMNQEIVIS